MLVKIGSDKARPCEGPRGESKDKYNKLAREAKGGLYTKHHWRDDDSHK